jgi:hypothetical protein
LTAVRISPSGPVGLGTFGSFADRRSPIADLEGVASRVRRSLAPPGSSPFIDVWDALSYDRPYRRAWPRHQVLDYIRDQAGALFDPRMVEAFLDVAPYRTLTPAPV